MDVIASKLKPEVVVPLLGANLVLQTISVFVLVGAATRLFTWRLEVPR